MAKPPARIREITAKPGLIPSDTLAGGWQELGESRRGAATLPAFVVKKIRTDTVVVPYRSSGKPTATNLMRPTFDPMSGFTAFKRFVVRTSMADRPGDD